MSETPATVFLRLDGPLQAWGTGSHHSVRATDEVPSKSGLIGLICSAMGLRRCEVHPWLKKLNSLRMGVRVDRPGRVIMDYHTSGAGIGLMSAQGKIKITQTTGEIEPQVSRCCYLADASFLVVLIGESTVVQEISINLQDPKWPPFLGRKSCPPSLPVYAGEGRHSGLEEALASQKWRPRTSEGKDLMSEDNYPRSLRAVIEINGAGPHRSCIRVQDVPLSFSPQVHDFRYVKETTVKAEVERPLVPDFPEWHPHTKPDVRSKSMKGRRRHQDRELCVFCKEPAENVHHVTYERAPFEEIEDLRSVCSLCHAALTMIEYSEGRIQKRLDPSDTKWRSRIIMARQLILNDSIPLPFRRRGD